MKIYGMEKLSLVDYEGKIAVTLFTAGCNFRCPFCHNSTLATSKRLGEEIPESEIFGYLNKRKGILNAICITGGEPTLNKDLVAFVTRLKEFNLAIKLDTNGTNPAMLKELVEKKLIDYVAMDIKSGKLGYPLTTGVENIDLSPIQESIDYLMEGHVDYEFRTTLVDELHSEEDFEEMAKWLAGAKKLYLQKFKDSGDCIVEDLHEVPLKTAEKYLEILSKTIKKVELRNY